VDEPFVGRAAELAELGRQFTLAASGQGRVVVLAGPAGGGKTALIGQCLARWAGRAQAVLVSGDEAEAVLAGGVIDQLAQPGPGAAAELAAVMAGGRSDPLSAGSAALALLRERARAGPLVVVVDDAQWADELSLRALSFAVRRLAADPVLCLVATQPDGLDRLPPGLLRVATERGARLGLAGLDAGEVAALAERAGAGRLPGRAAERLREHTGGIPLHVRELLHDLPGHMLRTPGLDLPASRSLQTLVVSRLAGCTLDTEALVVAAAVLGTDCELADAATLARLTEPRPALQQAIEQRLLVEPTATGRRRCAFGHALIRTAVYQDIGVSRRAALHRAAAELTGGSVALAHRVAGCAGADGQLAADLAARADVECAAGRLPTAAGHLLMAARVADDRRSADRWLLEAVGLLIDQGDAARARGYGAQISAMVPSAQRDLLMGRLDLLAGAGAPAEQQIGGAWAALAAEAGASHAPTDETAAKAACELAQVLAGQQRLADAASWAQRAADAAASWLTRACSRAVQGGSLAAAGQAARARALLEAELAQCTDDAACSVLHTGLGRALLWADDLPGAAAHLTAATTADQTRLSMTHVLEARLLQVDLNYRAGYWDQAAADGERLITLIDDLDQGWLLRRAHLAAVYSAAGRGHWHAAASHADAAAGQPGAGALALADARTAIAVARDDVPAILAAAADVADPGLLRHLEPSRVSFWPSYAAALARTGQHAQATRTLRPYEQRATSCARRSAMAAASRARGVLHACRHHYDDALAAFDVSLAHLDGLGMPLEEAMTRLERGRLLRRAGQHRAAARDIGTARVMFAGLRARPFLDRCEQELGAEPPVLAGPDRPPLTARQLLVARAVAAGKSNREIAGELYISVKTVEFHLGQILARLDLDSRTQIADALGAPSATAVPAQSPTADRPDG
jgi:ATP/maltotriose-dependent transcriptional regulator MalT